MLSDKSKQLIEDFAESIDEIMVNAKSVHGEAFVDFMRFVNRNAGIIKLTAASRDMPDAMADQVMAIVCDLMGQSTADYGVALGFPREKIDEALALCSTLQGRMRDVEQAVVKEGL